MNAFDPRPQFLGALDQLEKLVSGLDPALLDRPTPCDAYDLRGLLGHTVGAIHRIAYIGEGGRGLDLPAAVGQIADTDWGGAVGRARARAAAAWANDDKIDREFEVPWGVAAGRIALSGYVMETVTHTWDIAQVIAPETELDEDLAGMAFSLAQKILPAEPRGGEVPFAKVQPVPDDADIHRRLAAWLGRAV
ncbi:TIGR03086 family metal-binding protein [Streptomyces lydicus]|uniref:TIGR03086 family metal-binding protein n=1 Tax=Streptomyces lydicus TaxID=47763 RepID=UPI000526D569|nr:TIGR03086 family metal-binding protein [Streptomyces lydicus]MDC7340747.1 TIGR03086 family metal-binding protein [Streptomyces lydicus]UEG89550.1 TIGR03086 family protein [Streptomyces lydicus]